MWHQACSWLLLALGTATVFAAEEEEVKSIPLRTHTLQQPYLDSDMQSRWFDFGGDTIVRTDQYVRLTPDKASRDGWLWSRVPLTATNWEIEVEFKIHGQGNLYGDGMAMWITKNRAQQGKVFGSIDKFEGLGIFFDTYKNNRPGVVFPYVMGMLGDGNTEYDKEHDGKANELAGCSARGIRNQPHATKARLTYFQDKQLTLELAYKNEDDWTPCFSLPGIKLPSVAYLGFSAETGELSDNHDIISVQTKNLYQPNSRGSTTSRPVPAQNKKGKGKGRNRGGSKSGGGWGWFFLKFLLFGALVAGAYIGFTMWRSQRNRSRF